MEAQIIKAMLAKATYEEFRTHITADMFLKGKRSPFYKMLVEIDLYFEQNQEDLTVETLKILHIARMQGLDENIRKKVVEKYHDVSEASLEGGIDVLFKTFRITDLRFKAEELMDEGKYSEARRVLDDIAILDSNMTVHEDESLYMNLDLEEHVTIDDETSMQWFLPSLKELTGALTKGTTTLILARSNAGKTSFIVPQVDSLLTQGYRGIHFALSEDGREELAIRYAMGAFHVKQSDVLKDKAYTTKKLAERYEGRLKIINTGRMSAREIEKEFERLRDEEGFVPDFAVYDQYQKMFVKTNSSANTAEVRTEISAKIKDMGNKFDHHAICATQADQNSGWTVTEMNVDGSKTGVVGEFKTIIGIGKQDDDRPKLFVDSEGKEQYGLYRNINVAKNKGKLGSFRVFLVADKCYWEEE